MIFSSLLSIRSHPMRVRGLKLLISQPLKLMSLVAPHAGAWIETPDVVVFLVSLLVAPHAGAWIETFVEIPIPDGDKQSHPMRVRGLKLFDARSYVWGRKSHPMRVRGLKLRPSVTLYKALSVAPHAGAWIETSSLFR